jgi:alginate O-acetyltransferase complex protein AlgI
LLFNSLPFLIFFPTVLALYYLLPRRGQNLTLLIASYVFYATWDWRFLSLIIISTIVDYFCGLQIDQATTQKQKRSFLAFSLFTNLLILGFFKYFGFFYESAISSLSSLGIHSPQLALKILLPVGISFYTFQTMSYSIDIYKGKMKPTRNFLNFSLFVAYFPQLVAGPIERAKNLLPQIEGKRRTDGNMVLSGCWLILLGFFKKVVIGDGVAGFVDQAFSDPSALSGSAALGAAYLFAIQIYGDFSGYSDIARGCSRLLGIELMVNFRQPYLAKSMGEFWRRWHISLSTWFRDYVYIPLGGNRLGHWNTYRNLWITFLVTGFWHGANWTFLLWGVIHGVYLVVEKSMGLKPSKPYETSLLTGSIKNKVKGLLQILLVFHLAVFAFVIFRGATVTEGWSVLQAIFTAPYSTGDWTNIWRFFLYGGMLLIYDLSQELKRTDEPSAMYLPAVWGAVIATLLFIALLVFGGQVRAFIYFQF